MSRCKRSRRFRAVGCEALEMRRMLAGEGIDLPCDDFYQVVEDGFLAVTAPGILDNDFDPAATLDIVPAVDPVNGVVVLLDDGSFTYTPNPDYFSEDGAVDTFSYSVTYLDFSGSEVTNTAIVHINVIAVNDPPIGTGGDNGDDPADAYTIENVFMGTDEERLVTTEADVGVLANDFDPDGDELIAVLNSGPANGVLVFREDGSFDYTPDELFFGEDTFTYFADDGQAQLGPVTVTLTVELNPPLEAFDDVYTTFEDVPLFISGPGVLENDEYGIPDPLFAGLVEGVQVGEVFLDPSGGFTYTPAENWSGDDVWNYVALRPAGEGEPPLSSNVATVLIHVIPVDDAAEGAPDEYHLLEGGEFEVGLYDVVQDGAAYYASNGSYYQFVEEVANFEEAKVLATEARFNSLRGRLAVIDAPEISQFLSDNVTAREGWIGGEQNLALLTPEDAELEEGETRVDDPNGGWTWLGRQPMGYTNWAAGQPNRVDLEVPDAAIILPDFDPPASGDPWQWGDVSTQDLMGGYWVEYRSPGRPTEGVLVNDTDVEGDPIAAKLDMEPTGGVLQQFTITGGFHYQPKDGFSGEDVFTYIPTWNGVEGAPTEVTMVVHKLQDVPGDANFDEMVDLEDFNILKENFGTGIWPEQGDADADGDVDLRDFALLKENFGFGVVEEPTEGEGDMDAGSSAAIAAVSARDLMVAAAVDQLLSGDDSEDEGLFA